jgi:hypothetical protein
VLRRMRELGHTRAYLTTESARTVATGLYRSLGFIAHTGNAEERSHAKT